MLCYPARAFVRTHQACIVVTTIAIAIAIAIATSTSTYIIITITPTVATSHATTSTKTSRLQHAYIRQVHFMGRDQITPDQSTPRGDQMVQTRSSSPGRARSMRSASRMTSLYLGTRPGGTLPGDSCNTTSIVSCHAHRASDQESSRKQASEATNKGGSHSHCWPWRGGGRGGGPR